METKKESIKIRITKKDKDKLKKLSGLANESISAYILRKSLSEDADNVNVTPQTIEIYTLLSDIYHEIEKYGDVQLQNRIRSIILDDTGGM